MTIDAEWEGMGEVVPARTSPTPTSPILSHCASIVVTSTVRVNLVRKIWSIRHTMRHKAYKL